MLCRSTTLVGGVLLHLQRRRPTPLMAAEHCTQDEETLARLRDKASAWHPPAPPAALRWLSPAPQYNDTGLHFTSLEGNLDWEDVEELCLQSVGERFYEQLREGSEPFGAAFLVQKRG